MSAEGLEALQTTRRAYCKACAMILLFFFFGWGALYVEETLFQIETDDLHSEAALHDAFTLFFFFVYPRRCDMPYPGVRPGGGDHSSVSGPFPASSGCSHQAVAAAISHVRLELEQEEA